MTPLLVGAAIIMGLALGWLLALWRMRARGSLIETELRRQIASKESELASLRVRETQLTAESTEAITALRLSEEQLSAERAKTERLCCDVEELRSKWVAESNALARASADLQGATRLLADKEALHDRQLQEARESQDKAIADLREAFKALSADALKQNGPEFLRLAQETFHTLQESAKGDLEKRQEAIAGLLKPLEEQLRTYQQRLQQSESSQSQTLGEVKKQLETLSLQSQSLANETERFRMVLRSNQARGRWGEETLRRVVEAAGMSAHCDFVEQSREEDKKPDMLVRLPLERLIIVDSKVPDLDFVTVLETADGEKRAKILEAHAAKLKETIKALAKRNYPGQFRNALDYVVLFLPAESLFSAALEGDSNLILWAADNRIMLATPTSLIALLRVVSTSWQQFAQSENARVISAAAKELYIRVARFTDHLERIRSGLGKANEAFNDAVGSYERMVRPSGDRLSKLGLDTEGKAFANLKPTESAFRLTATAPKEDTE